MEVTDKPRTDDSQDKTALDSSHESAAPRVRELRRLATDSGAESSSSFEFDLEDDPDFDFRKGYAELLAVVSQEQLQKNVLTTELKKIIDDRNKLKSNLSAATKERDILKLKCQELEQKVGILKTAEKARLEMTPKKSYSKTNASLKKLGLSEDILLALPFGYATKVRSAFEKLSYENEKLQEKLTKPQISEHTSQYQLEQFETLVQEKKKLVCKLEALTAEKSLTVEALEEARRESKLLAETNKSLHQLLALLGKEVEQLRAERQRANHSFRELLKNCAALSSLNSKPLESEHMPYDVLKLRCNLLSQINTNALLTRQTPPKNPDVCHQQFVDFRKRTAQNRPEVG